MKNGWWTNVLIIGITALFIGTSIVPITAGEKMLRNEPLVREMLDQENSEWDSGNVGTLNLSLAQSFQPRLNNLTRVELLVFNHLNPHGNITISIRDNLSSIDLTSITIPMENLPQYFPPLGIWTEFDFPDISIIPGHTYYIVLSHDPLTPYNLTFWGFSGPPAPYSRGEPWHELEDGDWEPWNPLTVDFCFKTYGYGFMNNPPNPPTIQGPHYGKTNTTYTFSLGAITDPEGDQLYCLWDWGDGNTSGWLGPLNSGETVNASHAWKEPGTYAIRVKLKDSYGAESDWSAPFSIVIVRLKTAFFLGIFKSINQTDDLIIIQTGPFIILPSKQIFYIRRTIVISKDYLGYFGISFTLGVGGVAIP